MYLYFLRQKEEVKQEAILKMGSRTYKHHQKMDEDITAEAVIDGSDKV